jgi:hypothetical protein
MWKENKDKKGDKENNKELEREEAKDRSVRAIMDTPMSVITIFGALVLQVAKEVNRLRNLNEAPARIPSLKTNEGTSLIPHTLSSSIGSQMLIGLTVLLSLRLL